MLSYMLVLSSLVVGAAENTNLNVTAVRLAGGSGSYEGRVEIKVNGLWGTICHDEFDPIDAMVLCKMMNRSSTAYFGHARHGPGTGPIFVDQLYCNGHETHIRQCSYESGLTCSHAEDVSLICSECGATNISHGAISSISSDGSTLEATCSNGNTVTTTCNAGEWSQLSMSCTGMTITDMRLTDGVGLYDGRIEVMINDTWTDVCSYSFSVDEATAICNILFGIPYYQITTYDSHAENCYGYGYNDAAGVYITQLQCKGDETDINDCYFEMTDTCYSKRRASVICNAYPLNITDIRLADGPGPNAGRVELRHGDEWGTVSGFGFDSDDGYALCRMLNLSYTTHYDYNKFGAGSDPVLIEKLECKSYREHINDCTTPYLPPRRYQYWYCNKSKRDVSLVCTECGNPNVIDGSITSSNGNVMTVTCDPGYVPSTYTLECLNNGTWLQNETCTEINLDMNVTDIRLVPGPYHGRVELKVNNTWRTVCRSNIATAAGYVVCRMLNDLSLRTVYSWAYYGEGTGPVYDTAISCNGNEDDINDCRFYNGQTCDHYYDVSVLCYGPKLNITDIRLANGTGPNDGRAEIKVNGTWGTICDKYFNIDRADTFCKMLGLRAGQYFTTATHGEGTGPVYIDELFCDYHHNDLNDCRYVYTNTCTHSRDVSVVCNECGKPDIHYWDVSFFRYNVTTLYADCTYYKSYLGTLNMTCDNDTKLWKTDGECKEYRFPLEVSDIRLVNGNTSRGRVEIKAMDTWGTVCSDGFSMNEANVICRMLGQWPALAYSDDGQYGAGTGPIFVDDLVCEVGAKHINNCTYVTYDDCSHTKDVSVVCLDCGDPTPSNGTINSTRTSFGAVVEVSCKAGHMLIGNATITCRGNGTWSDHTYCQFIDCKSPTPENGAVNSSSTTNGTTVHVTCSPGYYLSGNAIISCQSNSTWTDYPSCDILDCGHPAPLNANVDLPSNTTTYGAIAVISCKQGYLPDGSSTVTCLESGEWDIMPVCEIVDCEDPTPNKGSRNDTTTTYGTVVAITCDEGLEIKGNSTIVCLADGTWSDGPVCESNDCGRPSISNGHIVVNNGTKTGSKATITCNPGYDLVGFGAIVCNGSYWNDTSVECVLQDCGDPVPENGKRVSGSGTTYGDTATIECNEGYEMEGDSTISCQDGGTWTSDIVCSIKDCGSPQKPVNGQLDMSSGTTYNSNVKFSCDHGFRIVGEEDMVCRSDGTWSSDTPVCDRLAEIGEACDTSADCMTEGAICNASLCACQTGVHDSSKCDAMPLYPYGEAVNDYRLKNWNKCGVLVQFSPGLPAFGEEQTNFAVCPDGTVRLARHTISPFQAVFNRKYPANIYYRAYDVLNSYEIMKERAETSDIEDLVRKFKQLSSFEAIFILIATWDKVIPNAAGMKDISNPSTFQLVLTSNGEMTFTFFIYPNGLMQWETIQESKPNVFVGYRSNHRTYNYRHQSSFTKNALRLDKAAKHAGVSGLVFRSLVHARESKLNNNTDCIKWYQKNKHEKDQIHFWNRFFPECPCDISLARWDPWFWHIDRWNYKTEVTCVNMLPGRIYLPYGKSCCYDTRTSLWIDERPIAGGFFRYHPENKADHTKHDTEPKEWCCSPLSPFCKLYYDLRPIGSCYRISRYRFGSFWGDPHFTTLDGRSFTFNGLGEYTLLQILEQRDDKSTRFNLQARTVRAIKKDGNMSDATVFRAFAAKDEANASLHVEINRAKKGFNIYGNGVDLTDQFNNKSGNDQTMLVVPHGTLFVSKRGETLVALFPSSGISLNITVSVEMLSLSAIVPQEYQNRTRGLLGNFNGNVEDDFTLPNGTVLPANLTERELFIYGQEWEIDEEDSAFIYEANKAHLDYHNTTFVPRFLDEADPIKRQQAEEVCKGSENVECIFDFVFTEIEEIALETNHLRGIADETKIEMAEVVSLLTGCGSIYTNVNETVDCKVSIDDGNTVEFLANNVNATFDPDTKSITYFQATDEPVTIKVVSKNENGRLSTVFSVRLLLCTGCSDNGVCLNISRIDPRNTEYFNYATCVCNPQYEGPDCENVINGCAEEPCTFSRNCTPLNVDEQIELNRTYKCAACPAGFISTDDYNDNCEDYDECENSPCDHTCINTDGSYVCICNKGYRTDTNDGNKCTDINECEDLNTPHNCSQKCTNTDGAFDCSCYKGYILESAECRKDTLAGSPCDSTSLNCSLTAGCTEDDDGVATCFCDNGFELDDSNRCIDIIECDRNFCSQECTNTIGGFQCRCLPGFKLVGYTTCEECDIDFWGENCKNECRCTSEGVKLCDPVKGCVCEDGWKGETCEEDIDECDTILDVCNDPRKYCKNIRGSFQCICQNGFKESDDGQCEDIDECSVPTLNTCDQICVNSLGSYSCECDLGYITEGSNCEDINECNIKTDGCEQICSNNPGSYNCFCYAEYTLNDDRRSCTKLQDPCLTIYGFNCSHYCYISTDNAECRCQNGFILGSDEQTCTDIDECSTGLHTCDANAECKNTEGSYTCECHVGSKLENDGRTCSVCDDFHYGKDCVFDCNCVHGVCDKSQGCLCDNGWHGDNCDIDFDECASGLHICLNPNEVCVNIRGSATCNCLDGYVKNESGYCEDLNECFDSRLNTCDQKCVNIPGGYICECLTGFLFMDGQCKDIDECENKKSDCEQLCENTIGSYRCYCEDGFKLNLTNRQTCSAKTECSDPSVCGDHSICFNKNGQVECRCENGYLNVTGECEDINECRQTPTPCLHNCTNIPGSYLCSCNHGYFLTNDYTTCEVCTSWTYGDNCSMKCSCNIANSASCDHVTGNCHCKEGWGGMECNDDVNECSNTNICPANSSCNNTLGGYFCDCVVGYFKTSSGICKECDGRHFGKNCVDNCACMAVSTLTCNKETGYCDCRKGWTGINCSNDIDECDQNSDPCLSKENSTCSNTPGSYKCICDKGFQEIGDQCVDIDECLVGEHGCLQKCVNTQGAYYCKCRRGYNGYWNDCTECNNNKFGENCTEACPCNLTNTVHVITDEQSCDRTTGSCRCLPNWEGEKCDEDVDECFDEEICDAKPNYGCANTVGSYQCECYRGYKLENTDCVLDSAIVTTALPVLPFVLEFVISIGITLRDSENLLVPYTYDKYHNEILTSLKSFYQRYTTIELVITITNLSKGSLVVSYVVQYEENNAEIASAVVQATKELANTLQFTYLGVQYNANLTTESFDPSDDVCKILEDIGTCGRDACVESNGSGTCKDVQTDKLSVPQIIGICAGCVLFVLVTIAVVINFARRRTNKRKLKREQRQAQRYVAESQNNPMDFVENTFKIPRAHIKEPEKDYQ